MYRDSAAASNKMLKMQAVNTTANALHVKPLVTSNNAGEKTNTNGTNALPRPSLNAVLPVLNGSELAMPAAAYAASATGGVMSASTP